MYALVFLFMVLITLFVSATGDSNTVVTAQYLGQLGGFVGGFITPAITVSAVWVAYSQFKLENTKHELNEITKFNDRKNDLITAELEDLEDEVNKTQEQFTYIADSLIDLLKSNGNISHERDRLIHVLRSQEILELAKDFRQATWMIMSCTEKLDLKLEEITIIGGNNYPITKKRITQLTNTLLRVSYDPIVKNISSSIHDSQIKNSIIPYISEVMIHLNDEMNKSQNILVEIRATLKNTP